LLALAAGCGPRGSVPTTYKVTGSAMYAGGGPVTGGAVQFHHLTDTSFSVSGDVRDDGKFTLFTVKGSDRVSGAPEGEYQVTIQPPIGADHRPVPAISLPATYRVEPKDNHFALEVPQATGRP
jgi:hypothetical protein